MPCVLGLRIGNGLVMVPLGLLMLLAPLIRSKPQAADPYIYMGGLVFLVVGGGGAVRDAPHSRRADLPSGAVPQERADAEPRPRNLGHYGAEHSQERKVTKAGDRPIA